jgi:hypothetical protein
MRPPLLVVSMLGAALLAAAPARAADMGPPEPPETYAPPPPVAAAPPVMVAPPPVVAGPVVPPGPAGCWRYGPVGWGWYPCVAGPPAYWHDYRYGYRWRPYWARSQRWRRSYW